MADAPPPPPPQPPPPPPHQPRASGLPDGNYDIFIIPPHSAGSGFLYLPSLQPQRNSFLAGVACTLLAVGLWTAIVPTCKHILASIAATGGAGVLLLLAVVGMGAWAWGKTQGESTTSQRPGASGGAAPSNTSYANPFDEQDYSRPAGAPPSKPSTSSQGTQGAASGWEKAREETRKREEERKKAEDLKNRQGELQKKKEDAERAARAAADKVKWEQARAREKEAREREAREQTAKETRETAGARSPGKKYERPSAQSVEDEFSYRPYDTPPKRNPLNSSRSSASGMSESSWAGTHSTTATTPPPPLNHHRGPYHTKDPDKIVIKGCHLFNNTFAKPVSQLLSGRDGVTDGLILRITSEGLFIDDDVRGVPEREWDVKAWGLKLIETGRVDHTTVLRVSLRDVDASKYVFVLPEEQSWKVDVGLQRLRKGSQVRSMGMNGIKEPEVRGLLNMLGWA